MNSPPSLSFSSISPYLTLPGLPLNDLNLSSPSFSYPLHSNNQSSRELAIPFEKTNPFNLSLLPQAYTSLNQGQTKKNLLTLRPYPFSHVNQKPNLGVIPNNVTYGNLPYQTSNDPNLANASIHFQIKQNYGSILGATDLSLFDQLNLKRRKKSKHWTKEEDELLRNLIQKYDLKWCKMEPYFIDRKSKQIRDRYMNYLRPDVKQWKWTQEEDDELIQHYRRLGNKWTKIAKMLAGRSENQVKNRFESALVNRLKKLPLKQEIKNEEEFFEGKKIKIEADSAHFNKCEFTPDQDPIILRIKSEQDSLDIPSIKSTDRKNHNDKKDKSKASTKASKKVKNGALSDSFINQISREIPSDNPQNLRDFRFHQEEEFPHERYLKLEVTESYEKTKIEFGDCKSEF